MNFEEINIEVEEINPRLKDKDPQTIYVRYRSLFDPHPYLGSVVKIEFSVRSLVEPFEIVKIQSVLWQHFPNSLYQEQLFEIRATHPKKTLLEKMFLLHEKFQIIDQRRIAPEKIKLERGSRHLFDITRLDDKGVTDQLLADSLFYAKLLLHRRYWVRQKGIDYNTLRPATLNFRPPAGIVEIYQSDYATMRAEMIYGNADDFATLLDKINMLNERMSKMVLLPISQQLEAQPVMP